MQTKNPKFKTIKLPHLAKMLGYSLTATKDWCERYEVPIYQGEKGAFVFRCLAEKVWLTNLIIHLKTIDETGWREKLDEYLK